LPFWSQREANFRQRAAKSGEEGITFIGLRLAPSGQIVGSEIYRSSGHDDLDAAAMRLAIERIDAKPGSVNGKAVMTMIPVAVIWSPDAAR
jgi:TonB family protein